MKRYTVIAGIMLIVFLSFGIVSCDKKQGAAGSAPGTQTGAQSGSTQSIGAAEQGKLDINIASATELQNVPGIDATLAQNIVSYRDANGPFSSVDDLVKVQGMDQQKLDSVRSSLTAAQSSGAAGGSMGTSGSTDEGMGGTSGSTGTGTEGSGSPGDIDSSSTGSDTGTSGGTDGSGSTGGTGSESGSSSGF